MNKYKDGVCFVIPLFKLEFYWVNRQNLWPLMGQKLPFGPREVYCASKTKSFFMSLRFKKIGCFLFIVLCLFALARLYYRLTDDFRLANIHYRLPFEIPWQASPLTEEEHRQLTDIFDQKYSYVGKGAQCYAFVSKDGQYVLKFFKFKHLKPNFLIETLPSIPPFKKYKESCIERKKRKLIGVFNGYDLAFRENRQISELIYLHLLPSQNLHLTATVIDKLGWERKINLDDVVFLVQKKGETLRTRLRHLLKQHQLEKAKQTMGKILDMYMSEYKRGIYDHDHGVMHNTGFIGEQPFHLDVGKLNHDVRMKEVEFYKADLAHVIWKMDAWIKGSFPEYYSEFTSFLSQQYHHLTGDQIDFHSIDPKKYKKRRKLFGL